MNRSLHTVKVAAFTGGKNVPSARFRVRQLIPALSKHGMEMHEFIPPVPRYPPPQRWLRPSWGLAALVGRVPAIIASYGYDVVLFQRELISTLVTLEPLSRHPRVLDVDDAIFLHRGGKSAQHLSEMSDMVICGNDFLAERFSQWNRNVVVVPTAVDTKRFIPLNFPRKKQDNLVIGWIGSSGNFKYLYLIEDALEQVIRLVPNVKIRIVADKEPNFRGVLKDNLEFIPWSPEIEVKSLQTMTVGIMPLTDSVWTWGKCSFKMLQYMACGVPVVVSPVGVNSRVLSLGAVGLGASTQKEWIAALVGLLEDKKQRVNMGKNGRSIVEDYFSIDVIAPRLARHLRDLVV